jgi:hypothetical protein
MSIVCPIGYGVSWSTCAECPPGTYSVGGVLAQCAKVPKGFFNPLYGASEYSLPCLTSNQNGAAACESAGKYYHI